MWCLIQFLLTHSSDISWLTLLDLRQNSLKSLKSCEFHRLAQNQSAGDSVETNCRRRSSVLELPRWPPGRVASLAAVVAVQLSCVFTKPVWKCTTFRGEAGLPTLRHRMRGHGYSEWGYGPSKNNNAIGAANPPKSTDETGRQPSKELE